MGELLKPVVRLPASTKRSQSDMRPLVVLGSSRLLKNGTDRAHLRSVAAFALLFIGS